MQEWAMSSLIGAEIGNGRYRIDAELGHGGQGAVYRGTHLALEVPVAIKVLPSAEAQDKVSRTRFEREAKRSAQLKHPNIVQVYDAGYDSDHDIYYIVSDLIEGIDLKVYLASLSGPVPMERALKYLSEVGEALQYAHERGTVHRDIKPSNILLEGRTDRAFLCDFGLARQMQGEELDITRESQRMPGTPAYMSPEQCLGMEVMHQTDIYSLGLVAYEMLAGRHPFRGVRDTSSSLTYKQVHERPPAPRTLNPSLPPAVERVLARALAKAPADRYPSVAAFIEALREASQGRPSMWNQRVLWLGGAALLVVAAVAIGLSRIRPPDPQVGPVVTLLPIVTLASSPAPSATSTVVAATEIVLPTLSTSLAAVAPTHGEEVAEASVTFTWIGSELESDQVYELSITYPNGQTRVERTTQRSVQKELAEPGTYTWSVRVLRIKDGAVELVGEATALRTLVRLGVPVVEPTSAATSTLAVRTATSTPRLTSTSVPVTPTATRTSRKVKVVIQGGQGDWLKGCSLELYSGTQYARDKDKLVRRVDLGQEADGVVEIRQDEADWCRFDGGSGGFWKEWSARTDPNVIKLGPSGAALEFVPAGGPNKGPTRGDW
jgi:serine/threonine protein kinase